MITYYLRSTKEKNWKKPKKFRHGAVGVIEQATNTDVQLMAEQLHIDVVDLIDIFDSQEIPRLEMFDDVALLFIRTPLPLDDTTSLETQLCMVVLSRKQVWIAVPGSAPFIAELFDNNKLTSSQPVTVLLSLLQTVSKQYTQLTNEISKQVSQTRQRFRQANERDLEQLLSLDAILNEYVSALTPMVQICNTLIGSKKLHTKEKDADLITEVLTNLSQTSEICLVNLKKIHALRDSFQMVFTNRLNYAVQVLTATTIILTIPTMFASLFGMNVTLPFSNHEYSFWFVVGIALTISTAAVIWFKKKKMI